MITSPAKAIRAKCIDCCGGSMAEVKLCEIEDCALHPFRFGRNPYRTKRVLTEEERMRLARNLAKGKSAKNSSVIIDENDE